MSVFTQQELGRAVAAERNRCIKALCQHCAVGSPVMRAPGAGGGGYHILEEIQGHAYHTVACSAEILRLQ